MRTLFLIRHAKSSWGNPGLRDFDRPLNDRGLHDGPKMAQLLVRENVLPDLLVSSPAKRAITTAQFFADAFGIAAADIRKEPNIYEAHPTEILRLISELPEEVKTVCIFGHNPTFTEVANLFSEDDIIENVPTCGIVKITTSAADWRSMYEGNSRITACYFPKEVL
ncbi:MAG TPA: histidine phosphatase family protein [Saprospiraceae bacterium]|nr:histidine phosphatase family protein [Saprospiraceae bacterium]